VNREAFSITILKIGESNIQASAPLSEQGYKAILNRPD